MGNEVLGAIIGLVILILFVRILFWIGSRGENNRKKIAQQVINDVYREIKPDARQKKKLESICERHRLRTVNSRDRSPRKEETSTNK